MSVKRPSEQGDVNNATTAGLVDRVARRLAGVFEKHPRESVAALVLLDMISIYGTYSAITLAGLSFSSEVVLGSCLDGPGVGVPM